MGDNGRLWRNQFCNIEEKEKERYAGREIALQ